MVLRSVITSRSIRSVMKLDEQAKIKVSETLALLQQLQLYEKRQNDADSSVLSLLDKYEQQIQDRRMKES